MARSLPRWLGFANGWGLIAWALSGGVLLAFSLAHFKFLDFYGAFCGRPPNGAVSALPGECFYFLQPGLAQLGMIAHLYAILPAGVLASAQFVPGIRRRFPRAHRVCGRVAVVLGLLGAVSVAPVIRNAFGGELAAQAAGWVTLVAFVVTQCVAYVSIKRLRIDQHRAWMLRSWSYASGVITMRVFMASSAITVSRLGGIYMAQPCDKIDFVLRGANETLRLYPGCGPFYSGENRAQHVVVQANMFSPDVMQLVVAFNATYGPSSWLALAVHVIGAEIYLYQTRGESERLRKISDLRQREKDRSDLVSADASKFVQKTK